MRLAFIGLSVFWLAIAVKSGTTRIAKAIERTACIAPTRPTP